MLARSFSPHPRSTRDHRGRVKAYFAWIAPVTSQRFISLPELVDFKLFGKTILVVHKKLQTFFGQSTWEVSRERIEMEQFHSPVTFTWNDCCMGFFHKEGEAPTNEQFPVGLFL